MKAAGARLAMASVGLAAVLLGSAQQAPAASVGTNGRIVFGRDVDGRSELFSVDADGSNERRLTWSPLVEQQPAWSPDGTRIAYAANSGTGGTFRISTMNADGSGQTQLT